jgi:replicative DNA helicase
LYEEEPEKSYDKFQEAARHAGIKEEDIAYAYAVHRGIKLRDGKSFVGETPMVESLWGSGQTVLWARGEPLMLVSAPGLGKTTIAQQVALARLRGDEEVLGFPVENGPKRVLYIAADRPLQSARSLKRMVRAEDDPLLASRLTVWEGPFNLDWLVEETQNIGADTVFIDTLGAIASDLSTDAGGQRVYQQIARACADGVELCVMHHDRKAGENFRGIDEPFGSRWITAGMGSILYIEDRYKNKEKLYLHHLKTPAEPLYTTRLYHDHARGATHLDPW